MAKLKKTIAVIAAAAAATYFLLPTMPKKSPTVNYEYVDKNKSALEKVDYVTFRNNLDSGFTKQKIENQGAFLEELIKAMNSDPGLVPERGFNFKRGVPSQEFYKFVFEEVLKEKGYYEIKTPTDLVTGLNIALEYLAKYNHKMTLEEWGLGSDVNDDYRFDGLSWGSLEKLDKLLQDVIIKDPKKGEKISREECRIVDGTPTDLLLMGKRESLPTIEEYLYSINTQPSKRGEPNSVELICRNYVSALKVMFETAKERHPELTKDLEMVLMPMPGHVYAAFINKKTLEYIVVDPTWHDTGGGFDMMTFAWPKEDEVHYNCLEDEGFFETLSLEKKMHNYWNTYMHWNTYMLEFISHNNSKQMLQEIIQNIQELSKKYPKQSNLTYLEVLAYANLANHKEYSKAFDLLKSLYDNKERIEKMDSHSRCLLPFYLGGLSFELKKYDQALSYFKECSRFMVAKNPFVDEAMINIAETNLRLGNYYEALFRAKNVIELSPRHHKEAKEIIYDAAHQIWGGGKHFNGIGHYLNGDYKGAVQHLKGEDPATKLLLAKSYDALNNYEKAKPVYEELIKVEDKNIASIAESELKQMNRKFYLYAYMHFFDNKVKKSIEEFEYLKSRITPKEEIAERTSYLLMFAYGADKNKQKAVEEADYFLKTFPKSEFKQDVEKYLEEIQKAKF